MTPSPTLPRDALFKALGGDHRLVSAFEQQAMAVAETQGAVVGNADATDAIQDATVLVLSPNAAFNNERVLRVGDGIRATDDGTNLTLSVSDAVPHVEGGFRLALSIDGETVLALPLVGRLATVGEAETLLNKTIAAPRLTQLGDYADDVAAAAANVPVGAVYRTGSALKVRIA